MALIFSALTASVVWGVGITTLVMGAGYHANLMTASPSAGGIAREATPDSEMTVELSFFQAFGAGGVFLVVAAAAWWLELNLARELLVSYLRSAVQLICLGFILTPIFLSESFLVVITVLVTMATIASFEVKAGMTHCYPGMIGDIITSLLIGVGCNLYIGLNIIGAHPMWKPIYAITMWGMTLGNSLTAVSLGLERTISSIYSGEGAAQIESILSHGGTGYEATKPLLCVAFKNGLIPTIKSMNIIGLVSIPGMMTGQLLGGTTPLQAAYYQMMIIYMIGGSTAFSLVLAIVLLMRRLIDNRQRLAKKLIIAKDKDGDIFKRFSTFTSASIAVMGIGYFTASVLLCVGAFAAISEILNLFPASVSGYLYPLSWVSLLIASVLVALEKRKTWHSPSGYHKIGEEQPLL